MAAALVGSPPVKLLASTIRMERPLDLSLSDYSIAWPIDNNSQLKSALSPAEGRTSSWRHQTLAKRRIFRRVPCSKSGDNNFDV